MLNVRDDIVKTEEEFSWNVEISYSCRLKERTFCVHTVQMKS